MKHFKLACIALLAIFALAFSSCNEKQKVAEKVHYNVTVQGYVKDTLSLSQTDIDLHFTKQQSIEKQLNRFCRENGLQNSTIGKLKLNSGSIEEDVDAYLRKIFGKHITYDITAKGYIEYSSFIRVDIDKEFKR